MKVYVLFWMDYEDRGILHVFSSKEKALEKHSQYLNDLVALGKRYVAVGYPVYGLIGIDYDPDKAIEEWEVEFDEESIKNEESE